MGLFDFFKKKNTDKRASYIPKKDTISDAELDALKAHPATPQAPKAKPEPAPKPQEPTPKAAPEPQPENDKKIPETYYGDLEKTGLLVTLCQVPHEKRDQAWFNAFINNISLASFKAAEPKVVTGPDGFPYFQLLLPEPGETFQCYVLDNMVYDFLLTQGFGVVINANKEQPDWVLTYGDVMNYAVKHDFYNKDNTFFNTEARDGREMLSSDKEILVGQPSEFLLPAPSRAVLRSFLNFKGIQDPKILLMSSKSTDGTEVQDLVFNFTPKDFKTEEEFQAVIHQLQWFLPKHYSTTFFDEESALKPHFEAL